MSHIKLSVPNDDSCALFHIGKSLIELSATIEGSPQWVILTQAQYDELQAVQRLQKATQDLMQAAPAMLKDNHVDGSIEIIGPRRSASEIREFTETAAEAPTTDSTGTPWDDRIHSASKALNGDGTWRVRRKPKDMDEVEWADYVSMIKADLQHPVQCGGVEENEPRFKCDKDFPAFEIPAERKESYPNIFSNDEPSVTPLGDDFHVDAGEVTEQQVADIPPPPLPVPPAPPVQQSDMTFPQVMAYLTERHGRISNAQVEQIIAEMGLKSIMDLNTQPEHTGPFIARVKALLGE